MVVAVVVILPQRAHPHLRTSGQGGSIPKGVRRLEDRDRKGGKTVNVRFAGI